MTDFAPGQRWTYHTRPGEDTSTVTILGREDWPSGTVVHVRLDGLRLRNTHLPGGIQQELDHTPVSEEAVRASVVDLIDEHLPPPTNHSGYDTWLTAFERGEAGVFTLPLAGIVDALERAVNPPEQAQPEMFRKSNPK